jgi:hypothetical protein
MSETEGTGQGTPVRRSRRKTVVFKSRETQRSRYTPAEWIPPEGSWEDDIASVDGCDYNSGNLVAYVCWETGHKTRHDASLLYKKCPQKVGIQYLRSLQKSTY